MRSQGSEGSSTGLCRSPRRSPMPLRPSGGGIEVESEHGEARQVCSPARKLKSASTLDVPRTRDRRPPCLRLIR